MSPETVEFGLLVIGWIVAFLLGKELQTGYYQWRTSRSRSGERQS